MEQVFNLKYKDVFKKAIKAVKALGFIIQYQNMSEYVITTETPKTFRSWGEIVVIKFKKIDSNKTIVIVSSQTIAQLFSYGKNKQNEKKIFKEIESYV